jgi:hypothetical protein
MGMLLSSRLGAGNQRVLVPLEVLILHGSQNRRRLDVGRRWTTLKKFSHGLVLLQRVYKKSNNGLL